MRPARTSSSPSADEPRRIFVLGAYPSGLHVTWQTPVRLGLPRPVVKALIVDNEPAVFWGSEGAEELFEGWRGAVGFQDAWGTVRPPSAGNNGPWGTWLTEPHPPRLGLTRDDCWITDCIDTARRSDGQSARLADAYSPAALALGLPEALMEPAPSEDDVVREAQSEHLDRLRAELHTCEPEIVVTLGNAALRVLRSIVQVEENDAGTGLRAHSYGRPVRVRVASRPSTWLPLVHLRSGKSTHPWPETHTRLEAAVTSLRGGHLIGGCR